MLSGSSPSQPLCAARSEALRHDAAHVGALGAVAAFAVPTVEAIVQVGGLVEFGEVGRPVFEGAGGEVAGDSLVVIPESVDGFSRGGEEVSVVDGYVR